MRRLILLLVTLATTGCTGLAAPGEGPADAAPILLLPGADAAGSAHLRALLVPPDQSAFASTFVTDPSSAVVLDEMLRVANRDEEAHTIHLTANTARDPAVTRFDLVLRDAAGRPYGKLDLLADEPSATMRLDAGTTLDVRAVLVATGGAAREVGPIVVRVAVDP